MSKESTAIKVAFGLGSNLGNTTANIERACDILSQKGISQLKLSPIYTSTPVDCPEGSGLFANAAATGYWHGTANELLLIGQAIEIDMGRAIKRAINAPRPIDIDILIFGDEIIDQAPALIVPHQRMLERDFVLMPLRDIWPDLTIPGSNKSISLAIADLTSDQNAIC